MDWAIYQDRSLTAHMINSSTLDWRLQYIMLPRILKFHRCIRWFWLNMDVPDQCQFYTDQGFCNAILQTWMVFQFIAYIAGGLDGNVDLTGITDSGYTDTNKPEHRIRHNRCSNRRN